MDILSVGFVFGVFGSIWGMYYQTDKKLDAWRIEAKEDFKQYRSESTSVLMAIQAEIKEFHGRLCAIEERKKIKGEEQVYVYVIIREFYIWCTIGYSRFDSKGLYYWKRIRDMV